jgi:hypothetical protein
LLQEIQFFFGGVGKIYTQGSMLHYSVSSLKDISVIIAHFDKYPLLTQKRADFLLFKLILEMINRGEHLTSEGLRKIVAIRASINNGLSDTLKSAFPDIIPFPRPIVSLMPILDPH